MRRGAAISGGVLGALIVAGGLYFILRPLPIDKSEESWTEFADSVQPALPDDPRAAVKALRKVQSALAVMRPTNPYIVIDTHANKLSLRTADSILFRVTCSTGSGGVLVDSATGRKWTFNTPRGTFKVQRKVENPWWRKPDWAFIEEGEKIPKNENDRLDPEVLGDFALGFGDGYFIHGTLYTRLLGISVTHGCVRLGDDDLKALYKMVPIGTQIYIF